jgi:uncharacterized membrane-anchored protein YhcB (DUF1043 family)
MCETVKTLDDQHQVAIRLAACAAELDELKDFIPSHFRSAVEVIAQLHQRAQAFAGGRMAEIYDDEVES